MSTHPRFVCLTSHALRVVLPMLGAGGLCDHSLAQCTSPRWYAYTPDAYPASIGTPQLAFDDTRNLMVLVGEGPNFTTATWEFNGATWTFRHNTAFQLCDAPVVPFSSWIMTAGAGDTITGGGYNCFAGGFQTWLYNGTSWARDTSPGRVLPSVRAGHAMAYNVARGHVALFGGQNTQLGDTYDDTWIYDGTWSLVSTTSSPSARSGAVMTYDPVREVVIMTGGLGPSGYTRETWEFDGRAWRQRTGTQPPAMTGGLFAFDAERNAAVLYGGRASGGGWLVNTYEYRNGVWTTVSLPSNVGWDGAGVGYSPTEHAVMLLDGNFNGSPVMSLFGCPEPHIDTQPRDRNLCAGVTLIITVQASGMGDLTYQWRKNDVAIAGATSSAFIRDPSATTDSGTYTCVVTSQYGPSIVSAPSVVHVDAADPTILNSPQNRVACSGDSVTFTVSALRGRTFQWRHAGVDIPGQTTSALILNPVTGNDAGLYTCVVGNGCGQTTSSAGSLIVNEPPNVLQSSPTNVSILAGQSASMSTLTVGTLPITRRWFRNNAAISDGAGGASVGGGTVSGATAASVLIVNAAASDSGSYTLRADNLCGFDVSSPFTLTVTAPPACPADLDDGTGTGTPDGGVTIEDLLYYLTIFADGSLAADLDDGSGTGLHDGGVTIDDLLFFLDHFGAGC